MTSKEKAINLVEKFKPFQYPFHDEVAKKHSKKCALIAVDEIIELLTFDLGHDSTAHGLLNEYQEVKTEIEKL